MEFDDIVNINEQSIFQKQVKELNIFRILYDKNEFFG